MVNICDDDFVHIQILQYSKLSFALPGTGGAATVVFTVNDTETVVPELTPGADYTFSVTAENAVSSQDMNIFDRTVNITTTTKEGGTYIPHYNNNCV